MRVAFAYMGVIMIWSTTPLGIKWSNSSLSFMAAVSARMAAALAVCALILWLLRRPLIREMKDWWVMLVGALNVFPNMLLVYWAANHVPSGLVSVMFGTYPFWVGLFSLLLLNENIFSRSRVIALCIALVALILINVDQMVLGPKAGLGVLALIAANALFGVSSVVLKKVGGSVDPLRQLTGNLLIVTPCFSLVWFLFDGEIPEAIDFRSTAGVLYLAVAGSVIGGLSFLTVLKNCRVSTVSLITLITPVFALALGYVIEGEALRPTSLIGAGLIVFSLALYLDSFKVLYTRIERARKKLRAKSWSSGVRPIVD